MARERGSEWWILRERRRLSGRMLLLISVIAKEMGEAGDIHLPSDLSAGS